MDKLDQLFIRACKVQDSDRALRRIIKKFYMASSMSEQEVSHLIITKLAEMVDKYSPLPQQDFLRMLGQQEGYYWQEEVKPEKYVLMYNIYLSRIRYTHRDKFEGMLVQARIRNRK